MKILFFWFNLDCPVGGSLGVSILCRELKDAGHDVRVIHLNESMGYPCDEARIQKDVTGFGPDLFAFSFGGSHRDTAKDLAGFLHREFPDVGILCGGIQTTLTPEDVISWPGVKYLCLGEADGRIAPFMDALEKRSDVTHFESFWVRRGRQIFRNPIGKFPDIGRQSYLDLDAFDYERIFELNRGFAEVVSGRGCPYRCAHCQNEAIMAVCKRYMQGGFKVAEYCRSVSVERVIGQMRQLKQKFPSIKAFMFANDEFIHRADELKEFADRYRSEIGLPFIINSTAGKITEETADLLQYAGCNMVKFGVESGSEKIRKEILGKLFSTEQLVHAVELLHARDINVRFYIMIGIPRETREDIHETLRLCAGLEVESVRIAVLCPYPGTGIYDYCIDNGLVREEGLEIPSSYAMSSILKWSHEDALFIEICRKIFPWIMNIYLAGGAAESYQAPLDRVLEMSLEELAGAETSSWIQRTGDSLHRQLLASGTAHYHSPFSERTDICFLFSGRGNNIINVDT